MKNYSLKFYHLRKNLHKIILVMKIITLLLTIGLINVSASVYSQEAKINLDLKNASLEDVLWAIQEQTEFVFLYSTDDVNRIDNIDLTVKDATIEDVLAECLSDSDLRYRIKHKTVVIAFQPAARKIKHIFFPLEYPQPVITVTGKVIDNEGVPLPGVNIVIQGTTTGTITGAQGEYSIDIPGPETVLVFSYVGYTRQTVRVGERRVIDITLSPDIAQLEDVVVVGYGTMRRKDLTGSVVSVRAEELIEKPVTNFAQALQGRAAGLTITNTHGEPGADMIIRIRGGNSLKNDNKPLIVIDGIPTDIDLSSIAPSDIQSIDVLKDASSTAIYGSRGANGVLMITTNRGRVGKPVINFSTYMGFDNLRYKLPMLNGREYAELANERYVLSGFEPKYDEVFLRDSTAGTDWQDELFRSAPVSNYQLSISGGNEDVRYFTSFGFFDQNGIVINSYFKRYTLRLNLDANLSEKLKVMPSVDLGRTNSNANSRQASVVYNSLLADPLDVVTEDGEYYLDPITGEEIPGSDTPLKRAMERINQRNINYANVSLPVYYNIIPDLTLMVRFGVNFGQTVRNAYTPLSTVTNPSETRAAITNDQGFKWVNENTLNYTRQFDRHSLNLMAGMTFEEFNSEYTITNASGFENDNLTYHNLSAATILLQPASGAIRTSLVSGLFRVNYVFNDKYLFTATGRRDGSSKFGTDHKWGFFPSAAIAWRLVQEDFIRNLNVFDNLKVRMSYGVTGNQNFPAYSALDLRGNLMTAFGNTLYPGTLPTTMPNSSLSWETTSQMDAGIDMAFFRNRLALVIDYYNKTTDRLMLDKQIPYYTGFTSVIDNVGKLENKGVELTVDGRIFEGDFQWTSTFNVSYNKNKVLSLANNADMMIGEFESSANYAGIINNMIIVGEPLGTFYGFKTDGVYQWGEDFDAAPRQPNGLQSQPGDVRYVDVSGPNGVRDSLITDDDRVILGSALPKWSAGFSNTFSYKNIDLTIFANAFYGNKIFNMSKFRLYSMTADDWNSLAIVKDHWRAPELDGSGNPIPGTGNPSNTVPRLLKTYEDPYIHVHDRFIEDGSFIRIRNITFGYNVPDKWLSKLNIQQLRIYGDMQNYFTFTKYEGYDPEVSDFGDNNRGLGIDKYTFPMSKSWVLGLQLRF